MNFLYALNIRIPIIKHRYCNLTDIYKTIRFYIFAIKIKIRYVFIFNFAGYLKLLFFWTRQKLWQIKNGKNNENKKLFRPDLQIKSAPERFFRFASFIY